MKREEVDLTKYGIKKRFITYKEAKEIYCLGINKLLEHTRLAGATYKIDSKVLINKEIFDAYLEQYRVGGEFEGVAKKHIPNMAELYGCKSRIVKK